MKEEPRKETASTEKTLWDIGSDLEDILAQFRQVGDLLYLFDELISSDILLLGRSNDIYVKNFLNRYDTLRSMPDVMKIHIGEALDSMQLKIDEILEEYRKSRNIPLQTE